MLTFTQADLDNLKAALVTGALEVQVGERRVKYRTQAELITAMKMVQAHLDEQNGVEQVVSTSLVKASFSKGGN